MKINCTGCGAPARNVPNEAGGAVGYISEKTGYAWLPSAGGGSVWLCKMCAERLLELAQGIVDLVGDLYSYPPTIVSMLKQSSAEGTKR